MVKSKPYLPFGVLALLALGLLALGCSRDTDYAEAEFAPSATSPHGIEAALLRYEQDDDQIEASVRLRNVGDDAVLISARDELFQDLVLVIGAQRVQGRVVDIPDSATEAGALLLGPGEETTIVAEFPLDEKMADTTPWHLELTASDREHRWSDQLTLQVDATEPAETGTTIRVN